MKVNLLHVCKRREFFLYIIILQTGAMLYTLFHNLFCCIPFAGFICITAFIS